MNNPTLVIVGVVVVLAAVALAWMFLARKRHERLRSQFGPEYDRTVRDAGSTRQAETVLEERAKRVSTYRIRELNPEERGRFDETWRRVQAKFVDDPAAAVTEADLLVTDVMTTRGYPMTDFERRAEDLTVDHANVVQHYRQARDIAARHSRREASTEDLRQAVVHYRELFADLLQTHHQVRRSA